MRIYYYGKLIADTDENKKVESNNQNNESMTHVGEVLKGQFGQIAKRHEEFKNPKDTDEPSTVKPSFVIRHYQNA